MGMVVRTNTMAINAYRQLGMNNSAVAKSLEKLASGYRINRAGDDAAGLAISEKMKAQITGLETASSNAQDGISLIQTAEGNLNEVHDMLNRMVELATKSANGTYTQTERDALQSEVNQLLDEIDRISASANFNGAKLLDGTMGLNGDAFKIGNTTDAVAGQKIDISAGLPAENVGDDTKLHTNTAGVAQQGASFKIDLADFELDATKATANDVKASVTVANKTLETATIDGSQSANQKVWTASEVVDSIWGNTANWAGGTGAPADTATEKYVVIDSAVYKATKDGSAISFEYAGATANGTSAADTDEVTDAMLAINAKLGSGITVTTAGTTVSSNSDSYHGVLDVNEAKKAVSGQRAGIEFDLTKAASLFADGAKLNIDGTTFTFKLNADSEYEGNVIDLSNVKGAGTTPTTAEYAKEAAAQLSHMSTGHFEISDGGSGIIKVDQTVADYDSGNNAPYTTYKSLTDLFSATGAGTDATSKLTVDASKINAGDAITVGDKTFKFVDKASGNTSSDTIEVLKEDGVQGLVDALNDNGFTATANGNDVTISKAGADAPAIIGGGLTLQIGDTADSFNKMNVSVGNMSAKGLGLKDLKITKENLASDAIDTIKNAINTVSSQRADLGALQNRLEHTINNLDVAAENLSAANSRIRDTDMAKEMMNYTKMNVLVQSAQAMLAQANQQPQSVLQLLQ